MIALLILVGFVGLIAGGELLVRGASGLAVAASVSPLIIGLTVVAFGTSSPELAVSVASCFEGKTDLAVGNIVGSNVANVLFILGGAAIVAPLAVHLRLFKLDVPVMLAASGSLWLLGRDGALSRMDGLLLTSALIGYFYWTVTMGRREARELQKEYEDVLPQEPQSPRAVALDVLFVVVGLILLVCGADWLVDGCVRLAQLFNVSELVIGLTVVAVGTSLPELAASVLAAMRGHRDLAVGNVVGSNILNVLAVLGVSAIVAPAPGIGVGHQSIVFDIPVMIMVCAACLPALYSDLVVTRWEGVAMLALYGVYVGYIVYTAVNDITPTPRTTLFAAVGLLAMAVALSFPLKDRLRR